MHTEWQKMHPNRWIAQGQIWHGCRLKYKTGDYTITVVHDNGVRFKTLVKNVEIR